MITIQRRIAGGDARNFKIVDCTWDELRELTKAAVADGFYTESSDGKLSLTQRFVERCKDAVRRGLTVKQMFSEMERGASFDDDVAQFARPVAGRES